MIKLLKIQLLMITLFYVFNSCVRVKKNDKTINIQEDIDMIILSVDYKFYESEINKDTIKMNDYEYIGSLVRRVNYYLDSSSDIFDKINDFNKLIGLHTPNCKNQIGVVDNVGLTRGELIYLKDRYIRCIIDKTPYRDSIYSVAMHTVKL